MTTATLSSVVTTTTSSEETVLFGLYRISASAAPGPAPAPTLPACWICRPSSSPERCGRSSPLQERDTISGVWEESTGKSQLRRRGGVVPTECKVCRCGCVRRRRLARALIWVGLVVAPAPPLLAQESDPHPINAVTLFGGWLTNNNWEATEVSYTLDGSGPQRIVERAKTTCMVSNSLRQGIPVTVQMRALGDLARS